MFVRLLMPHDREAVRALVRAGIEESAPDLGFDEEVFNRTFDASVTTGHPTCFVVVDPPAGVVGVLLCVIEGFYFHAGLSTAVHVIYVAPAKRGTRAPALLMQAFLAWSEQVGARRKHLGIGNSLHPDRTARFFERFGARRVGYELVIE
jgi:GNAT superfamily N-acetyltransferase